jgi:hypothetical protein
LYYLNSRYYNPEIGRFINADGLIGQTGDILGHNMYAYTQNNPVMMIDPSGEFGILATLLIGGMIGAAISGGINTYQQIKSGESFNVESLLMNMAGGFVAGVISAIPIPGFTAGAYLMSGLTGGVGSLAGGIISGSVTDLQSGLIAFGIGAAAGMVSKGVAHVRFNIQTKSITSLTGKARSIAVNDFLKNNSYTPVDFGKNTFGGWSRNMFKNISNNSIEMLVDEVYSRSAFVYSAIVSSSFSGWYKNGY